jgi:hypothetical protein
LTALPDPLSLCGIDENLVMADADRRSAQTGDALLMDEWSNSTDLALVDRMAAEADRHVIGWTAWAYEDCCDSPAAIVRDGAKPPTAPGNLNTPVLRALARPYPRLVAGTPQSWSFDPANRAFRFAFSTSRVGGGSFPRGIATEVELPALQYPTGYAVAATGARVVSPPDANRLRLVAEPGAAAVRVTVTPADHHPTAPGPFAWPAGAQPAPTDCPPTARLRVRLRKPARRVVVTVDGVRTATRRGHELHRITLPPGLADGSSVILRATLPGGRRATEAHRVLACRLR